VLDDGPTGERRLTSISRLRKNKSAGANAGAFEQGRSQKIQLRGARFQLYYYFN